MPSAPEARPKPAEVDLGRITQSTVRDTPAGSDALGFAPYVEAIAAFLDSPSTQPPFTLSLEGEWGCGKSPFMKQLEAALNRPGRSPSIPVSFNAWRFDKQDALWAAFALAVTRELRHRCTLPMRLRGAFRLFLARVDGPAAWLRILQFLALWALFLSACLFTLFYLAEHPLHQAQVLRTLFAVKTPEGQIPSFYANLLSSGAWAGAVGVLAALLAKSGSFLKSHLFDIKLEKIIAQPDYAGHTAFIEDFHRDFSATVRAYAGNRKVYVFVDDLDRCDLLKAAELMQAINLMIGEDDHLVFILGIDRDKIAAGIAAKYKDVLPYLINAKGDLTPEDRLAFGHQYLEKFIQLSFRIPLPDGASVLRHFVERLTPDVKEVKPRSFARELLSRVLPITDLASFPAAQISAESPTPPEPSRTFIRIESGKDSRRIVDVVLMVSHLFGNNPRRLKQFLNAYRLSLYLASSQGLLDVSGARAPLTLEQLGKLVALVMRFPALSRLLLDDPRLLAKYEVWTQSGHDPVMFEGEELPTPPAWVATREVGELLKFGRDHDDPYRYTLRAVDVTAIVRIMPTIPMPEPALRVAVEQTVTSSTTPSQRPTALPPAPQPGLFSLILTDAGRNKLETLKIVRNLTGLSLAEAKPLIDGTSSTLFSNVSLDFVRRVGAELNGIATVQVVSSETQKTPQPPASSGASSEAAPPTDAPPTTSLPTASSRSTSAQEHIRPRTHPRNVK